MQPARRVLILALLWPAIAQAQAPRPAPTWAVSRTADGQPDLEGIWTNATPLENILRGARAQETAAAKKQE